MRRAFTQYGILIGVVLASSLALARELPPVEQQDACVRCHLELEDGLDADELVVVPAFKGVHFDRGFGCADCHGGDPAAFGDEDAAMYDAADFRGAPGKADLPAFCGRCHSDPAFMRRYDPGEATDQESKYYTSRHGKLLRGGEDRVAACVDCHGVHGILPASNPLSPVHALNVPATCGRCHSDADLMADFGIPADQYEGFASSVHGVALLEHMDVGAPACNDCHSNHGAVPPGVGNVANVCGNCHVNNQRLFSESHVADIFIEAEIPLCVGCHNKHDIAKPSEAMLDWQGGHAVCQNCHEEGHIAQEMAMVFHGIIDSLKISLAAADSMVELAEQKGMEVSGLLFGLEDAYSALVQTRTSIHSFNEALVRETAAPGRIAALAAVTGAESLLGEFSFRRRGYLASTLIITFLIIMIWLKLRQIESRER